jgi:23S rRNA pseudouridine1911/1915/1917 synthase
MRIVAATESDTGKRLDALLHAHLPEFSRARIQGWIKAGRVLVNGSAEKASYQSRGNERIEVDPAGLTPLTATAENIPLTVLYEDEWMVAIDKPAGMVVHAGAGVDSGTVVNALLHRFETLSSLGGEIRPGIVHRLDRYTSGVLLVAKTDAAHQALAQLFATRTIRKSYLALVHRPMETRTGRIDKPIARDPVHRTRMTARLASGRAAWSEWEVIETFPDFSYLDVSIGTGRTHQIRVHLASLRHPVAGDTLYGAPAQVPHMPALGRYFLHAHRIAFVHPFTGAAIAIVSPLAPELGAWLELLRNKSTAIH